MNIKIPSIQLLFFFFFIGCFHIATAQVDAKEVAQKVANAYGFQHFKNVTSLSYTFNVKRDTFPATARSWKWNVKENIITMITAKETVTYRRDTIQSNAMKNIDGKFINDQYWLLFPYHLLWDAGTIITTKNNVTAPISQKESTMLTIQYNNKDGYTPGDAYDLFINENYLITEWNFRKGNAEKPSLTTTWQENEDFGKIKIATNHLNADGKFRIWFTGVEVK